MKTKIHTIFALFIMIVIFVGSVLGKNSILAKEIHGKVNIDKKELFVQLEESQISKQVIKISNISDSSIVYSAYKIADEFGQERIKKCNLDPVDPEDELGSGWFSAQHNFERTGYNPVESSIPTYALKWKFQADKALHTPVISGRNLYIPSENGNAYWIDSRTGIKKGLFSISMDLATINLHKKYLILTSINELFVYDRLQMTILWKAPCSFSNLYSIVAEDESLFYTNGQSIISCNIATGIPVWEIEGRYNRLALSNSRIFAISGNDLISSLNKDTGSLDWQIKFEKRIIGSPICSNNRIFITTSSSVDNTTEIQCLDFDGNVMWSYNINALTVTPASMNENYLYIASNNGNVNCIDKYFGMPKWKQELKYPIHVPAVITYGYVFIGMNDGSIIALKNDTGEISWSTKTKFPIESPLVVAQGFIYAADNTGTLNAYGRDWENVEPPMPPDRLNAFPGNNMITLSWRAIMLEQDLAGYHVYRKMLYEKDFTFKASLPFINNYQDKSVKNNNIYFYIIRAFDTYGNESTTSNMVTGIPNEKADPFWISFEPTSGEILRNKEIAMKIIISSFDLSPGLNSGIINLIHSGDLEDEEPVSIKINLEVKPRISDKPRAPVFSSAVPSDTRVTLSWIRDNSIQTYLLYRSTVSLNKYHLVATLKDDSTIYQDDTVKNDQQYYYMLKGIDKESRESEFSEEISVIPKPLPVHVNIPNNSQVSVPVFSISGRVDPKAKLVVNNQQIPLLANGFFEARLGVTVGENFIPFNTFFTSGEKQEYKLRIFLTCEELKVLLQINSSLVQVNSYNWPYLLEAPPIIVEARTYVTVRFISEVIGATVKWDPIVKKITIIRNNIIIDLWLNRKMIRVNGQESQMDAYPFSFNGRTMVPLRFIIESLGADVVWNKNVQLIVLTFKL